VAERIEETTEVVTLVLTPSDGGLVRAHRPGQYVSVAVDLFAGGCQPRQYTVSTGSREQTLQITVTVQPRHPHSYEDLDAETPGRTAREAFHGSEHR
jgi:ferredoxin-NADP reductase